MQIGGIGGSTAVVDVLRKTLRMGASWICLLFGPWRRYPVSRDCAEAASSTDTDFELWCGGNYAWKEWFSTSHEYWARDIDFEIHLWEHSRKKRRIFVGGHNVEIF